MRVIDKIIIHCSATIEGKNYSAKDVEAWHKERGMKKIGYHFVINLDGLCEKGRSIEEIGAHCIRQNENSIGICYIGGLDKNGCPKDTRTAAQVRSMDNLLKDLLKELRFIQPGLKITVHGHREYANKACPCFDARQEYINY